MKLPLPFLFAVLGLTVGLAACTKSPPRDPSASKKPTINFELPRALKADVTAFVNATPPNRSVGYPGHAKAEQFLTERLMGYEESCKAKFYVHEFLPDVEFAAKNYQSDFDTQVRGKFPPSHPEFKKWQSFTTKAIAFVRKYAQVQGRNLILEVPGTDRANEVLYIGAHYDTITHNHKTMEFTPDEKAPGADDNASAVAAALQILKSICGAKYRRTIRFVFFDYEEIFFLGSYALGKDLANGTLKFKRPNEVTLGLINIEMIGHSTKPAGEFPIMKIYSRIDTDKGSADDSTLARVIEESVKGAKLRLTPTIMKNGFNRSDNWSFWQHNIPAITVSQDWEADFNEARYHTATDTPDTLNYDFMSEVTQAVQLATERIAEQK